MWGDAACDKKPILLLNPPRNTHTTMRYRYSMSMYIYIYIIVYGSILYTSVCGFGTAVMPDLICAGANATSPSTCVCEASGMICRGSTGSRCASTGLGCEEPHAEPNPEGNITV